ncbi:hypothetical protein HNR12_002008 [Streptomonospora nanhaiensis]|uniref:Uncharacterized protein n=1 Tax=Streptomonospora nanhaiensis TaxID=1323731 RepID=A0A853BMF0_9ACTN|nr:hypothetical protein [Streptomonospora nanhaiensis]
MTRAASGGIAAGLDVEDPRPQPPPAPPRDQPADGGVGQPAVERLGTRDDPVLGRGEEVDGGGVRGVRHASSQARPAHVRQRQPDACGKPRARSSGGRGGARGAEPGRRSHRDWARGRRDLRVPTPGQVVTDAERNGPSRSRADPAIARRTMAAHPRRARLCRPRRRRFRRPRAAGETPPSNRGGRPGFPRALPPSRVGVRHRPCAPRPPHTTGDRPPTPTTRLTPWRRASPPLRAPPPPGTPRRRPCAPAPGGLGGRCGQRHIGPGSEGVSGGRGADDLSGPGSAGGGAVLRRKRGRCL